MTRTPGRLLVTLSDDARPFNPLSAPAPDLSPDADEREIGGLGIHLCREMFDQLTYERCDGRNVVTLEALLGTEAGTDS